MSTLQSFLYSSWVRVPLSNFYTDRWVATNRDIQSESTRFCLENEQRVMDMSEYANLDGRIELPRELETLRSFVGNELYVIYVVHIARFMKLAVRKGVNL